MRITRTGTVEAFSSWKTNRVLFGQVIVAVGMSAVVVDDIMSDGQRENT